MFYDFYNRSKFQMVELISEQFEIRRICSLKKTDSTGTDPLNNAKEPVSPVQNPETFVLCNGFYLDRIYWTLSTCGHDPGEGDGAKGPLLNLVRLCLSLVVLYCIIHKLTQY